MTPTAAPTPLRLLVALLCIAFAAACSGTPSGGNGNDPGSNGSDTGNGGDDGPGDPSEGLTWNQVLSHWVENNSDPRYPENDYLVGIGSAAYSGDPSLGQAETQARERLLAFFETQIQSEMTQFASEIRSAQGDAPEAVRSQLRSTSSVRAVVDGTAEGFQLKDRAISPDRDVCYALVVLDRKIFADNKKVEIDALKREVTAYYQAAVRFRGESSHFSAIGQYLLCLPSLERLVTLIKQYNLGKPPYYESMGLDITLGDVLEGLLSSAREMTFAFHLELRHELRSGDVREGNPAEVESKLIDEFNSDRVAATVVRATPAFLDASATDLRRMSLEDIQSLLGEGVNYVIIGTLTSRYQKTEPNRMDNNRDYHWYRCAYDVQAIELQTGNMWPLATGEGRVGTHYNDLTAASRAAAAAARDIAGKLKERFSTGSGN